MWDSAFEDEKNKHSLLQMLKDSSDIVSTKTTHDSTSTNGVGIYSVQQIKYICTSYNLQQLTFLC